MIKTSLSAWSAPQAVHQHRQRFNHLSLHATIETETVVPTHTADGHRSSKHTDGNLGDHARTVQLNLVIPGLRQARQLIPHAVDLQPEIQSAALGAACGAAAGAGRPLGNLVATGAVEDSAAGSDTAEAVGLHFPDRGATQRGWNDGYTFHRDMSRTSLGTWLLDAVQSHLATQQKDSVGED
jgi:hypothetical protein